MAIGIMLQFDNMGADKYDAVMKELGLKLGSNSNWPDGIITHTAGKTASGWLVLDVWESEAAFGKFRETKLGPAFAKVGGLPEPKVTNFEVHNRFPR
jgi:hypothetical protein